MQTITDNIIVAYEVFYWLNKSGVSYRKDACAIKIDMSKAYDRVECGFVAVVAYQDRFFNSFDSNDHAMYFFSEISNLGKW